MGISSSGEARGLSLFEVVPLAVVGMAAARLEKINIYKGVFETLALSCGH